MAFGPGRYNELADETLEKVQGEGLVLAIFNGTNGHGFEVAGSSKVIFALPKVLREMADSIEKDLSSMVPGPHASQ